MRCQETRGMKRIRTVGLILLWRVSHLISLSCLLPKILLLYTPLVIHIFWYERKMFFEHVYSEHMPHGCMSKWFFPNSMHFLCTLVSHATGSMFLVPSLQHEKPTFHDTQKIEMVSTFFQGSHSGALRLLREPLCMYVQSDYTWSLWVFFITVSLCWYFLVFSVFDFWIKV
jgi:hypothetical protein